MNTFGYPKIDKLKWYCLKKDLRHEDRLEMGWIFKQYFHDGTFYSKAGNIYFRCTPTKLSNWERGTVEHNLQMPTAKSLLTAFEHITLNNKNIQNLMKISEIHLTEDVVLSYPVFYYVERLKCLLYSRLEVDTHESNGVESLSLHYKHKIDSDGIIEISIKFYNKAEEYFKNHKTYICKLVEPLSESEIEQVGDAYDPQTNTLDLSKIYLLRIEIELHRSDKIAPITEALSDEDTFLTLPLLLEALREGSLYRTLDKIFKKILREKVFTANSTIEEVTADCSQIRALACEALLNSSDLYYWQAVEKDLSFQSKPSPLFTMVKKIRPDSELYNELYNKLFESTDIRDNSVQLEYFVRGCSSYSSEDLRDILLAYSVPIWDDS